MKSFRIVLSCGVAVLLSSMMAFAQGSPTPTVTQGNGPGPPPEMEAAEPIDSTFVPVIESRAEALKVLSATRRGNNVRIMLKNVSAKNICGFRMSYYQGGAAILFSFVMGEGHQAIAPGEVYKYDHSLAAHPFIARQPLTFQAVLFEDGTGDGEADKVKPLQDLFTASRRELESTVRFLEATIDAPNVETFEALDELEKQLSEIKDFTEGLSLASLAGVTLPSWKATALHFVEEMKRMRREGTEVRVQEELSKIRDEFRKSLARYPSDAGQASSR
ncbi:MAG TPA: hypothetical protein VJT09_02500 [Pyrinomonadaceae bacterium]|nr:hypothetical protein [Pyrinomonadaceae bacterium]